MRLTHRLDPPGIAHHVIQYADDERSRRIAPIDGVGYLRDLREIARREQCQVHAYVLMTDRVHLLVTPRTAGAMARTLQALERSRARYTDDSDYAGAHVGPHCRRTRVVGGDRQLLRCLRDIELQPVCAGIVADPISYRWSSHRHHVLGMADRWLTPHRALLALGRNPNERRERYRRLVIDGALRSASRK